MLELTTGVMFLMSSLYGSGQTEQVVPNFVQKVTKEISTSTESRSFTKSKISEMESYLRKEYADMPIMVEIARCESEFRQFNADGTVLRGRVTPDDIGVMQINQYYHGETAKNLGIDIFTTDGNIAFAKYLYSKYGNKPWSASAPCWSKSRELAQK